MSSWTLIQVVFDIFAALGFLVVVMRMSRAPKDDPRLSRGLQLLQSKIAVLEDLSDRTEVQATQLSAILEQKCREVQAKVQLAEQHVHEIRVSMDRSLEVAKIFQDKIPHQEIIERQNTVKYVQAARLAHQGLGVDEIAKQVDLPKGEIEFIAKVNRDQLRFNEDHLPQWARDPNGSAATDMRQGSASPAEMPSFDPRHFGHERGSPASSAMSGEGVMAAPSAMSASSLSHEMEIAERNRLVENLSRLQFEMHALDIQLSRDSHARDLTGAFEPVKREMGSLQKIGDEFRKACDEAEAKSHADAHRNPFLPPLEHLTSLIPQMLGHNVPQSFVPTSSAASDPSDQAISHDPSALPTAEIPTEDRMEIRTEARTDARTDARAKVQAALAQAKPPIVPQPEPCPDLAAARAMAKSVSAESTSTSPVFAAKTSTVASGAGNFSAVSAKPAPVIRKVQFPKIEMPGK